MRLNVLFQENNETISAVTESNDQIGVNFSDIQTLTENDYNKLHNKPIINSVVLEGEITAEDLGLGRVYYDTTRNWESQTDIIPVGGSIYIYSDYTYLDDQYGNRTYIAGIKIGDGLSNLSDLPFVNGNDAYMLIAHITDQNVHIDISEREFWNNKVTAFIDPIDNENLVLSKTAY